MPKIRKSYFSFAFLVVFLANSLGGFAYAQAELHEQAASGTQKAEERKPEQEAVEPKGSPKKNEDSVDLEIQSLGFLGQEEDLPVLPPDPFLNLEGFQDLLTNNLFTGEARFDIPLVVPPGRKGLTPELTLSYSSFKRDYISPYGYGFDLSTSSIFRNTRHGLDQLYTRDDFAVKLAGKYSELVLVDAQADLYMAKDGNDFNKYFLESGQWRVQDTQGNEFHFGEVASARQADPEDSGKVYQWMLTRIVDPNGNEVEFTYSQDNNQIYLDSIEYAVLDTTEPLFKIDLVYLTKPTGPTSYHAGFPVKTLKLLESIDVQENASSTFVTKKSYEFTYHSTSTPISRLTSVTQTAGGESLPAIDFEYYTAGHAVTLLKKIDNNTGGEIHLEYTPSTAYRNSEGKQNFLPFIVKTLSKLTYTDTARNISSTKDFTYHGGHYFYDPNEVVTREYAGFHEVISVDSASTTAKTYFHQSEFAQDNASSTLVGEFEDHLSKKGRVWRQEIYDDQDDLFASTITKWGKEDLGNDRFFVSQDRVTKLSWDGDATHRDTAEEFTYDDYGNVEDHMAWGEVDANENTGAFTDTGTDKFTTEISYALNATDNIVAFPGTQTVYKQDGTTKIQERKSYYDGLTLGNIDKGNLTKQEDWVETTTYVDTEKTYNAFGLVLTEKDPRDNTTTYTYNAFDMYAASSTNAKSQVTEYTYDYIFGKVKTVTDPNDRVFETVYDGFGRVTEEKVPDLDTPSNLVTKTAYAYTDDVIPRSVRQTHYLDASTTVDVYTYFDGFNRKIQERKEAESADTFAVKDFTYNNLGLPEKESLPYFDTGATSTTPTASSTLYTTYAYDALKRVTTVANAVATSTNEYDDWTTTVTDGNGNTKDITKDAYGRLVQVVEYEGENDYTTTYEYDGLGNLTKITDSAGNERSFTYDGLGRRTSAEDLHDSSDGTFGTWSYEYDAAGNLTKTTDPKGQVIDYTYDQLNRVLTEDFAGEASTEILYGYDSGTNGIGRLTNATTTDVVSAYTYNAVGGVATETETIDSTNYVTEYGYDRQGNVTAITYPDSEEVQYTYNTAGLLESIGKKESGEGAFSDVVSDFDYAPTGKVTYKKYGNDAETTNTYDEDELYRLKQKFTSLNNAGSFGEGSVALFSASLEGDSAKGKPEDAGKPTELPSQTQGPKGQTIFLQYDKSQKPEIPSAEQRRFQQEQLRQNPPKEYEPKTYPSPQQETEPEEELVEEQATEPETDSETEPVPELEEEDGFDILGFLKNLFRIPIAFATSHGNFVPDESTNMYTEGLWLSESITYNESFENGFGDWSFYGPSGSTREEDCTDAHEGSCSEKMFISQAGENWDAVLAQVLRVDWDTTYKVKFAAKAATLTTMEVSVNQNHDPWYDYGFGKAVQVGTEWQEYEYSFTSWGTDEDARVYFGLGETDTTFWIDNVEIVPDNLNRVWNPSFENDFWNWSFWAMGGAGADATNSVVCTEAIDGACSDLTDVTQTGQHWEVQLNHGLALTGDTTYVLTFHAKAAAEREATLVLGQNHDPWSELTAQVDFTLYPDWNKYVVELTPSQSDSDSRISFFFGEEMPDVHVDDVRFWEKQDTKVTDQTPEFSAIYDDEDVGDTATDYQIQVVEDGGSFASPLWDSGKASLSASSTEGTRTEDISYGGSALPLDGKKYYWRIKLWDEADTEGPWTNGRDYFFTAGHRVQDISYTYDPVGNITQIDDNSYTDARKLATFAYDDLYRLTSATATQDNGVELYDHTFTYDSIGNITSKSDIGSYLYQETDYANPHATTSVNGTTYSYDNNGNLLSDGNLTLVWDYRNRVTSISNSSTSATSTYAYNHENQRVKQSNGTTTTIYPNKLYNTDGTTETKHIFDSSGDTIATVETASSTTTTYYNHPDHLTGSNVVTDQSGNLEQTLDYFPFGEIRLNDQFSDFDEQRKFTGQEYDDDTNLHYYVQRYYNQDVGRFTSQDPVFLNVGTSDKRVQFALSNPQFLNSYSYVANNPLKYVDEEGEFAFLALLLAPVIVPAIISMAPALPALFDQPDIAARMTPGLGDALDAGEAVSGRDAFTGEQLSGFERSLSGFGAFAPFASGGQLRAGREGLINALKAYQNNKVAGQIAGGHALGKHLPEFKHLGIESQDDFAKHIESVINNPTQTKALRNDRTAFMDNSTNTIVIHDPNSKDGGTAFIREKDTKGYFNSLE